jgi:hypothetical protein
MRTDTKIASRSIIYPNEKLYFVPLAEENASAYRFLCTVSKPARFLEYIQVIGISW